MDDETFPAPPADDAFVLRTLFEGAEQEQYAANRRAARRAEDLADALDYARRHPWVYVDEFAEFSRRSAAGRAVRGDGGGIPPVPV